MLGYIPSDFILILKSSDKNMALSKKSVSCNLYLALQIGSTRIVCKINIQSRREEMHLHSAICHLSSIFWKMDKLRVLLHFFSINYPITSQIIYLLQVVLFWDIIFKPIFFLVCWKTLYTDFMWLNTPFCKILIQFMKFSLEFIVYFVLYKSYWYGMH